MINVVTGICLGLMVVGVFYVVTKLFLKRDREEKIAYVRTFKKGKGFLIYLFAVPLYWVAFVYDGQTKLNALLNSVPKIADLIVLNFNVDSIRALMQANGFYAGTMYFCFILVTINAALLIFSLIGQYAKYFFTNFAFKRSKREKLIVIGNNENNISVFKSEKNRTKILADKISDEEALSLYMKNIAYARVNAFNNYISCAIDRSVKTQKGLYIVVNTGDDEKNIELARLVVNSMEAYDVGDKTNCCFGLVHAYVFGDPRYEAIYADLVNDGKGCVFYVNKYKRIAIDFIDKYPFTRFMDDRSIDYGQSTIKKGVDVNAVMIGFGKTNQQLFLTSIANNQFITKEDGEVRLKQVKYFVFDKNPTENDKNLNHKYNRYANEFKDANADDYLPFPDYPADKHFSKLDVNDAHFYEQIREIVKRSDKDANFIIIAFGSDLENIDMAQKLRAKAAEWEVGNLYIFVKVRKNHQGQDLLKEDNCYAFGNEDESIFNIEKITHDKFFTMAMARDVLYAIESVSQRDTEKIDAIKKRANYSWYVKKTQLERDSNAYCCLSLRMKLHLMGLDYCSKEEDEKGLTNEEYLSVYAPDDKPQESKTTDNGKPIIKYTLDFKDSRRRNMAEQEHLRWNSFMISNGVIPATKEQILNEKVLVDGKEKPTNGKNYGVRRHGNITTFAGLVEFRKMVAERDGVSEEEKDVIKYDYQILDDAYWLLDAVGMKIIKKKT